MPAAFGFNYIAEAIFHIRMERIFHSGANHYFMPPLAAFHFLGREYFTSFFFAVFCYNSIKTMGTRKEAVF
jgi:hypothetical protein